MNSENLAKIYVIESKKVSKSSGARGMGKKGGQKLRPSNRNLLKGNIEKMSLFRLSIILMKTNKLSLSLHCVGDNKRLNRRSQNSGFGGQELGAGHGIRDSGDTGSGGLELEGRSRQLDPKSQTLDPGSWILASSCQLPAYGLAIPVRL